jgi:hypothetical protein
VFPKDDENIKKEIDKILMPFYDQDTYGVNDRLVDYKEPPVFFDDYPHDFEEEISKKVKELGIDIILKRFDYNDEYMYDTFYIYKKNGKIVGSTDTFNNGDESEEEYHENQHNCFIELMRLCEKHGLNLSEEEIYDIIYY